MFSFSPPAAAQSNAAAPNTNSVLWTNMESNKVMCPTFSVMLVRTIKALCEINVRFDHKLEISGSLHVRSDGDKVMTCLIDEESIKGAQDLSILDAVRFTMPYAAAALAPMALPGGFGQQPGQFPEALMSPVNQMLPQAPENKDKPTNNGTVRPEPSPHVLNIVPTDNQMDMSGLTLINNKPPELQMAEAEAALLLQRRLSNEGLARPELVPVMTSRPDPHPPPPPPTTATTTVTKHKSSRSKTNHSSASSQATVATTTAPVPSGFPPAMNLQVTPGSSSSQPPPPSAPPPQSPAPSPSQNHVKLPNIQTFAGMLPRLPSAPIKTESKEAVSPLPRSSEPSPSFPSPPQNLSVSSPGASYDPLVGVKIEVQSQVDADGNVVQKKKFQCMFCGIFLSTKCYLKNHINAMHTKARVYPCEVCEKYFYSAGALRIHKLRNHWQGSKKHRCDHCGETFLLPIELRKHLMKKHAELEEGAFEGSGLPPPRTPVDGNTAPSSASSSPRAAPSAYPPLGHALSPGMLHGSPVFPVPVPHTSASDKELVAAAAAAISMETSTEDSIAHSSPVFPSPIPQALVTGQKSAIASAVSNTE